MAEAGPPGLRKNKNLMTKSVLCISTFIAFLILECNSRNLNNEPLTGYNLSRPDTILILPDILHEISGLTIIGDSTVACIQDEYGIVTIYDISKNEIKGQLNFNINGDYEDIARVGKTLYILRSDGVLFEISDFESDNFNLVILETGIPAKDNEGLCYDMDNNRLLIACKSKRSIYSFDLSTKTLSAEPAFTFDVDALIKFAHKNKIKLKTRKTKKDPVPEPVLKFRTSAICINPVTKKLFLISAEDHLLFIFNIDGRIEHVEKLHHKMFIQPEGLTFTDKGDMLISNEGKDKNPTIVRFDYKN
jgi:WD40 repeat protein